MSEPSTSAHVWGKNQGLPAVFLRGPGHVFKPIATFGRHLPPNPAFCTLLTFGKDRSYFNILDLKVI